MSKRIEFLLNDRLLQGTTDFITGEEIPPNQDYIKLLNEKQIQEYSEEARKKHFEATDDFAPMPEAAQETAASEESEVDAPVNEQGEPIRPPRDKQPSMKKAEPRMKRADSNNKTPHGMEERSFIETATGSDAVDGVITPEDIPDELRYYRDMFFAPLPGPDEAASKAGAENVEKTSLLRIYEKNGHPLGAL